MSKEMIKSMKQTLMCCAQGQMGHLESVDAKELGEVIDMIKDLEEAMYYCVITEAMEKGEKDGYGKSTSRHYCDNPDHWYKDWDNGRMYYYPPMSINYYSENGKYNPDQGDMKHYYSENASSSSRGGHNGGRMYHEKEWPYEMMMRDHREGQSPMSRRRYMEAKEMKHDKNIQLQELEKYMKELSDDVVEMIDDASSEEKKYLANKISALATKVSKLDG